MRTSSRQHCIFTQKRAKQTTCLPPDRYYLLNYFYSLHAQTTSVFYYKAFKLFIVPSLQNNFSCLAHIWIQFINIHVLVNNCINNTTLPSHGNYLKLWPIPNWGFQIKQVVWIQTFIRLCGFVGAWVVVCAVDCTHYHPGSSNIHLPPDILISILYRIPYPYYITVRIGNYVYCYF